MRSIAELVSQDSIYIWDICCDHGLLSFYLLDQFEGRAKIYSLDQVSGIIEKLKTHHLSNRLEILCMDGTFAPLHNHPLETVIVSGVGGHVMMKMLQHWLTKHSDFKSTLILSAHKNQTMVKSFLVSSGFILLKEVLIEDKHQRYEVIVAKK